MLKLLGVIVFIIPLGLSAAESELPAFADYSEIEATDQVLEAIDFASNPDAKNFKTRLEYNLNEPANFAGHYILTYWGCGTMCQVIALIDVLSGEVFFPPELVASYGACYKPDSELIILNPSDKDMLDSFEGDIPDWLQVQYYRWDGEEAHLLTENQQPVREECEFF